MLRRLMRYLCTPASIYSPYSKASDPPEQKKRKLRTTDEHTHHISTLEVEAKDAKKEAFHILVDDVLYGPFAKIKYV